MPALSWKHAALAIAAIGAAYALGRTTGASAGAPAPAVAPVAAAAPRPVVIAPAPAAALDPEALRVIVREELAALEAARRGDAPDAPADAERQAERVRAAEVASAVVERGVSDGVWSDEERAALREQLPKLGEREVHQVLSPLFVAINAQRLRIDGPPI